MTAFLVLALVSSTLGTQALSHNERARAVSELEASRKVFLDATRGLSPAQWNYKPAPDRWSIAECAEHIALAEDVIFGADTEQLMKTPAETPRGNPVTDRDDEILRAVEDRSQKFKAPEMLVPAHRLGTSAEILSHFETSRDRSVNYLRATQDPLRDHRMDHPALKSLDGFQWLLMMSAHTRRHTAQILEVKADPNFPKS